VGLFHLRRDLRCGGHPCRGLAWAGWIVLFLGCDGLFYGAALPKSDGAFG